MMLCLLALLLPRAGPTHAQSLWYEDQQRLNVGLKLFPAFLDADRNLDHRIGASGELPLLIVHEDQPQAADSAAASLRALATIRGLPIRPEIVTAAQLAQLPNRPVAGIFVATSGIPRALLEQWTRHYQVLVFSPFVGDVERGAVAGIYVSDRILPYLNPAAAQHANLEFTPLFLRIAKRHEP